MYNILTKRLVFSLFTSFQQYANSDPKDKVLITILRYVLTQGHYQPQEINDTFSENVYNDFLKDLDPAKRYFIQSDIDEFSKYRFKIKIKKNFILTSNIKCCLIKFKNSIQHFSSK